MGIVRVVDGVAVFDYMEFYNVCCFPYKGRGIFSYTMVSRDISRENRGCYRLENRWP